MMPVGPYPDFAACVADNQDKQDPEGYCASIEANMGTWIIADVQFDTDQMGREAERLAREGKMPGISADIADVTATIEVLDTDEAGQPTDWLDTISDGEIIGATQLAMPAFKDAHIEFVNGQPVAYVAPEGKATSDKRFINEGALRWRDPSPLMFLDKTTQAHQEAVFVGNLTNFRRQTDGELVAAAAGLPIADRNRPWDGAAAQKSMFGTGDTPDFATARKGHFYVAGDGTRKGDYKLPFAQVIGGTLTAVPKGVFACAAVLAGSRGGVDLPSSDRSRIEGQVCAYYGRINKRDGTDLPCPLRSMSAAGTWKPPGDWFTVEEPDRPTPLTISDDGQIFGHLAEWQTCHIGFDACVTAPPSPAGYSFFHTGSLTTAEGDTIRVGQITLGTGHAAGGLTANLAVKHYDDTGTAVADVRAVDGRHGVWLAGAIRPTATEDQIETLRRSSLSGDWRRLQGNLELVAALAVNVPGFAVARVASGEQVSLVAAGVVGEQRLVEIIRRLTDEVTTLRAQVDELRKPLLKDKAKELAARFTPKGR